MSYYTYDDTKPVVASSATTYYVRFNPAGWATFTVDDVYGSLSIISDWGNWSRIWSADPRSLGAPNFTSFLAKAGIDYLAFKLLEGESQEINLPATIKNIKEETLRARRSREISKEQAEEIWAELQNSYYSDEQDLLRVLCYEGEAYFEYDTIEACFSYEDNLEYKVLTELLLPTLQTHLKALCATI